MADYPISNVPRRVQYVNSGVGPYAFTFAVLVQTDIAVYRGITLLTLTTDYSVTINANGTGSITLVTAGTGNITIVGARAIQRSSDYTTGGDLFANTLNVDLDSQTIFSQQLAESANRTVTVPVTDASTLNMELPISTVRANKLFAFTSGGQPTVSNTTVSQLDSAVASFVNNTGNNAISITYNPAGTGAAATTVQAKLRQTVNVLDFGADPTGIANSSAAFNNAMVYLSSIGGGTLIAVGSFRLNSQVDLLSNVYCDFTHATFYKGATFDYLFKATNKTNIQIYGGNYLQAVYTPLVSMLTGDYSNGLPLGFITCTEIKVIGGVFEKYYGGINVYDCSDVVIDGTYHNFGNAGIAVITTNIATQNSSRIWLINNDIIGCGDDGIAVGPVASNFSVTHCFISNNYIDKARLATGPTAAAVGIRTGTYSGGTGQLYFITINDNIITETTEEGLFLTHLNYSSVTNNIVSNFANFNSRSAILLGSVSGPCSNIIVSNNSFVVPASGKGFGINASYLTNSRIINNTFEANDPTISPILLENSSYIIFNENRVQTSAAVSFVYTNVTSNITFANNFLSGIGTAPGITGAGNKIYANNGYVTENSGFSSSISTGGTIAHGLAGTPAIISVIPLGAPGPSGVAVSGVGATTFTVNWSGGGSYQFYWSAKLAGSF